MFNQFKNALAFLTSIILICCEGAEIAAKDVTLTPNANIQDGATVTLIKDTVVNSNNWNLNPTDNIDWNIKISLDSTWGIHASKESRIRLIIDSSSTTGPPLLVAFSGTDGIDDEFFTVRMFMDNSANDKISPDCLSGTAMPHIGDIENIITNNAVTRASQAGLGQYSNFKPNNTGNVLWEYPMQFIIENDPVGDSINFVSHQMNDPFEQNCVFLTAFNPDNGLQIYIGGDIGVSYTFTSFRLVYEYDTTPPPTGTPTPAPIDCVSNIDQIIDVGSFTGWNSISTPEPAEVDTFVIESDTDRCYSTNPCIKMKGIPASGSSDIYIERTLDVSNYAIATIGLEVTTHSMDSISEMGYIEMECDTNTPQRTEFHHGLVEEERYSGCFQVNVDQCNSLLLRIGGYMSGTGDKVYVTQLILQYETASPTNNPTPSPTTNPTPAPTTNPIAAPTANPSKQPTGTPTPAPTDCFSVPGQLLDTTSLTGWTTVITPAAASNTTFQVEDNTEDCYAINPCIVLRGEPSGGVDDVYIQHILDVSNDAEIIINAEIRTESFENDEHGFGETICDSNTPQKIEFNNGIHDSTHYSGCFQLNVHQCNSLTLRIGGYLSGYSDRVFITKIEILFITASPTIHPTKYPTQTPSLFPTNIPTATPSKMPTKTPSVSPTKYPSKTPTTQPSLSPSNNPSISPTKFPTISPTKQPTINPTMHPSTAPTSESQEGAANDETTATPFIHNSTNENKKMGKSDLGTMIFTNDLVLIAVLTGTVLCLLLVICCFVFRLIRMKRQNRAEPKNNTMELARVSSMSHVSTDGIPQTGNTNTIMTPIGTNSIANATSFSGSNTTPMMSVATSNSTPMHMIPKTTDNMQLQENDQDLMDESETDGGNDEDDDMYLDIKGGKTDDGSGYQKNNIGSLNEGMHIDKNNSDDEEDDNLDELYGRKEVNETPGNN